MLLIPAYGPGAPSDLAAEARGLFGSTGADMAAVASGGLLMGRTDAPRIVQYCNTAPRSETRILLLPRPRHQRNMLRLWMTKRPFRRMIAAARKKKVAIVPNSGHTGRAVSTATGRAVR